MYFDNQNLPQITRESRFPGYGVLLLDFYISDLDYYFQTYYFKKCLDGSLNSNLTSSQKNWAEQSVCFCAKIAFGVFVVTFFFSPSRAYAANTNFTRAHLTPTIMPSPETFVNQNPPSVLNPNPENTWKSYFKRLSCSCCLPSRISINSREPGSILLTPTVPPPINPPTHASPVTASHTSNLTQAVATQPSVRISPHSSRHSSSQGYARSSLQNSPSQRNISNISTRPDLTFLRAAGSLNPSARARNMGRFTVFYGSRQNPGSLKKLSFSLKHRL